MPGKIDIPLKDNDEVIELDVDDLPDGAEALEILKQEQNHFIIWLRLAIEYYKQGKPEDLHRILSAAVEDKIIPFLDTGSKNQTDGCFDYEGCERDMLKILDTLAAYYVSLGRTSKDQSKRNQEFLKAKNLYDYADKTVHLIKDYQGYDPLHVVGKAYFCLLQGDTHNMDQAESYFNFLLNHAHDSLSTQSSTTPATLGQACIAFNRKKYTDALRHYKSVLKNNPKCPADVRLGLGLCYWKMGKTSKAKMCFERALSLDNKCVGALVGLAIIELNERIPVKQANPQQPQQFQPSVASIRKAIQLLSKAYTFDSFDPMVLNHLANHFFFKKDYNKVQHLALHAFHNTNNEAMRAESCYQLARGYHIQEDYDQAFQYYYQASQFASPSFVLPQYGLGQLYIKRGDIDNAVACFEKVLKMNPGNYETMKILGSLYGIQAASQSSMEESKDASGDKKSSQSSTVQNKKEMAKNLLKKVTQLQKDDFEAWIELAQILQQNDQKEGLKEALAAYSTAMKILKDKVGVEVPPEIHNNVAALHFRLGSFDDSGKEYDNAIERCKTESKRENEGMETSAPHQQNQSYYDSILISIQYNRARLLEANHETEEATKAYKDILRQHPNYIDCFLRLGVICRDRGQIYDASDWFKEGFKIQSNHADGWSLIGNLHLAKQEWGPAQKKFERILKDNPNDTYSLLSLANVWLETLRDKPDAKAPKDAHEKHRRHADRALSLYKQVLRIDPKNIYATNGIACLLAYKGYIPEARDVFAQVREATADFSDVWLNIAHVYLEQKQFVAAIQMYDNCVKKFFKHHNTEILLYSARSHYKAAMSQVMERKMIDSGNTSKNMHLIQCKNILLKARRVSPGDPIILFNLALIVTKLATGILTDTKSDLKTVLNAVYELNLAAKYFTLLHKSHSSSSSFSSKIHPELLHRNINKCNDLLSQAEYHVKRAKAVDDKEKEVKAKQDEERRLLQEQMKAEQERIEEEKRRLAQEKEEKRKTFVEQTKDKMVIQEIKQEPVVKKRPRKQEEDDFVNDSYSDESEGEGKDRKRKKLSGDEAGPSKEADRKREKKHHRRRSSKNDHEEKRKTKKKDREDPGRRREEDSASRGKSSRFKSKEFIEDDSDSNEDASDQENKKLVVAEEDDDDRRRSSSGSESDASSSRGRKRKANDSGSQSDSDIEVRKKSKKPFDLKKFRKASDSEDSEVERSPQERSDNENDDDKPENIKKDFDSDDEEAKQEKKKKRRIIESDDEEDEDEDNRPHERSERRVRFKDEDDDDDEVVRSPVEREEEDEEDNRSPVASPPSSPAGSEGQQEEEQDIKKNDSDDDSD